MKERVGSYEVVRVLARGGMAVVYLARQPALDRDVALKRLHLETSDPGLAQRFVREARLAAGLDHPNVVTLFDFFEDGGVPYIAMEYVGGGSLRPLVGRLGLSQVFGVLEGVLAGLAHAEAHGIAHRDLKPENVLITSGGGVKIADYGIARAYTSLTPSLTSTSSAIGTPTYMAPEQATDEPLGPHTDIYALGVIAFELLAGRPPFEGAPVAVLYRHVHKSPPSLTELAPDVPSPVCEWVEWLLAKPPESRPGSAETASQALEEIAVGELGPYWRREAALPVPAAGDERTITVEPRSPTPVTPVVGDAGRRRRRRRVAVAVGALALAGAAAATALVISDSELPAPRPEPALGAAAPYDFDGDGRQELALGMPHSAAARSRPASGTVVLRRGRGGGPATVLGPAAAHLRRPFGSDEGLGTSLASADFDRDGRADLAVSAPGRALVAIIHGTARGLRGGRVETIRASEMRLPADTGLYGSRILATDLDRDGYGDLVIGAPGADPAGGGSGSLQIVFGGADGPETEARTIPRPVDNYAGFGAKLRAGDVNGDGHVDLVEGAPDRPDGSAAGHLTVCRGSASGPRRCSPVAGSPSTGTSSLAVADVDGDRRDDIVQGDHIDEHPPPGGLPAGGEVRLWRSGRRGPAGPPIRITQDLPGLPGADEPGDAFGYAVDAGELDADRYADIVVGAPGDNGGAGTVSVVRGGRSGVALAGHTRFTRGFGVPGDPVPGEGFGTGLAALDLAGDDRLDVAVTLADPERSADAVFLMRGRAGTFAPGETRVSRLLRGARIQWSDSVRVGRAD